MVEARQRRRMDETEKKPKRRTRTVEPRKKPQQERSQDMVERILAAARDLMRDEGFKSLSTISIAGRAGLSVGSLYQYYPNKEAIIVELARRWLGAFQTFHDEMRERPPATDWDAFADDFSKFTRTIASIYIDNRNLVPVLEAMRSNKDLRRLDSQHDGTIVEFHADWYCAVNPRLDRATALRLGEMVLETGHPCLTQVAAGGRERRELILADLIRMHLALLRLYLDRDVERSAS